MALHAPLLAKPGRVLAGAAVLRLERLLREGALRDVELEGEDADVLGARHAGSPVDA